MISCIVIDDEPLALQQLVQYVEKTPSLHLKGSFESATEALEFLSLDNNVDLILLDINMPQMNGLEFAQSLPSSTKFIFVTAYREYAADGFELDAADYLLKPLSLSSFKKSIKKVYLRYFGDSTPQEHNNSVQDYIFVRSGYRSVRINLKDILYIESKREYMDIVLDTGEIITTHGTLNNMDERLPSNRFIRAHRSFIVNLPQMQYIERSMIVFGKQYIPISEQARPAILEYLKGK